MQRKLIAALVGALLIGGVMGGATLMHSKASAPATKQAASVPAPSAPTLDPAAQQRAKDDVAIIRNTEISMARSTDLFLTGSPTAHAEWIAASEDDVTCGVTPDQRYYIVKNAIGQTRYEETIHDKKQQVGFIEIWMKLGCDQTSPVNQQAILEKAATERAYQNSHMLDPACVKREFQELASGGAAAAKRQNANPHECYMTPEEYEAEMAARSAAASTSPPANNTGLPANPVAEGTPGSNASAVPSSDQAPE